jgi:hypothetical protein
MVTLDYETETMDCGYFGLCNRDNEMWLPWIV